jgi:hypothetical protein
MNNPALPGPQASAVAREKIAAKEYRICVSDTPAQLAEQVAQFLAQGWELHGYPFVDLQFQGNGNGNHISGNRFCQALLRQDSMVVLDAAPIEAAAIAPPAKRVDRPRVPATFRGVAIFLAVLAGGYLVAEGIVFRSGVYSRFLEPESSTGSFERTFKPELYRHPSGKKEVLIVGSSRLAEGFSAKLANQYKPETGFQFFNCAVPSAGPRTFYYMIRGLDPHHNRYAAIAIPIDDYSDLDDLEDVADRVSDMRLVNQPPALYRHHPVRPVLHHLEVPPRNLPRRAARRHRLSARSPRSYRTFQGAAGT